jgi:hypothetical protein
MAHDCDKGFCASRRDMIKMGLGGLTWGAFGLSLPNMLFQQRAFGLTPDPTIQKYDGFLQIFYQGGPSETDTWDPKPGSKNNIFNTIDTGAKDVYGNPMLVAQHFPGIVGLLNDPAFGLGIVRSMTHGNADHATAESYMNCYWGTPLATQYPSTAAAMAYYFQGQGIGIPSVVISGANGNEANDNKGANLPTALNVQVGSTTPGANPTVQELSLPANTDLNRYARRSRLQQALNQNMLGTRPDQVVKDYDAAWNEAYKITVQGQAAEAFNLTGKKLLPGNPWVDTNGNTQQPNQGDLQGLTLAQSLLTAGIPYVACGVDGNDTHSGNRDGVTGNWFGVTDPAVAMMAKNLKATGKRYLIMMFGEFGRTPDSVAGGRDGRDHNPDGFSAAFLSINQPAFKTTAIGNTGPDGMFKQGLQTPTLVDPMYPKDLGAMVYTVMGFLPGNSPTTDIPTAIRNAPPVDRNNNGAQLIKTFGLG